MEGGVLPGSGAEGTLPFPGRISTCILKQRALAFRKNGNYDRRHQSSEIMVKMLAVHTRTIIGHYKQMVFIHTEMLPCSLPMPGKAVCVPSRVVFSLRALPWGPSPLSAPSVGVQLLRALCLRGARGGWGVPPLFVGLGSKMV